MKERLDILMVQRNLAQSREKAKALIKAGQVLVDGVAEGKAGTMIEESALIEVKGEVLPYVSRGGLKLKKALESFDVKLFGKVCMDVGASTGGFTDCMLKNGAIKVYSVDVGHDQLADELRNDERVVCMEGTNIRYVTEDDIDTKVDFVSIDVSFISLTKVLLPVRLLMNNGAHMVCLIKPQFEAGRENVGKKGVVKEKRVHCEVIENVWQFAEDIGFSVIGLDFSPVKGPEGNIEYLLYLINEKEVPKKNVPSIRAVVESAHATL